MKKLTERECLEIGGHCWIKTWDFEDDYSRCVWRGKKIHFRTCKHCGRRERFEDKSRWIRINDNW